MGWNYQRNSSLVSFLFFFSGDGTQLSASDLHCEAKKLQFVSNTLFVQTSGHVGFSTAEPAICEKQSPLNYLDCHSVVTQRKALVMPWCDNKGACRNCLLTSNIFRNAKSNWETGREQKGASGSWERGRNISSFLSHQIRATSWASSWWGK